MMKNISKLFQNRRIQFCLLAIIAMLIHIEKAKAQGGTSSFLVDQVGPGLPFSFDTKLAQAVTYANLGNHAIIELNAPDYIALEQTFDIQLANNAKITIRNAPDAVYPPLNPNQGFTLSDQFDFSENYNNGTYTVDPNNCQYIPFANRVFNFKSLNLTYQTYIEILDVNFINFSPYYYPNAYLPQGIFDGTIAVFFSDLTNVELNNCNFTNNEYSIIASNNNLSLLNNNFENTYGVHLFNSPPNLQKESQCLIENNSFKKTFILPNNSCRKKPCLYVSSQLYSAQTLADEGGGIVIRNDVTHTNQNQIFTIDNNIFDEIKVGIQIANNSTSEDLGFKILIQNNNIESGLNLEFLNPMKHYIVKNNSLTSRDFYNLGAVNIRSITHLGNMYTVDYSGLDFVEANLEGIPVHNTGNAFNNIGQSSFLCSFNVEGNYKKNFQIIGLSLPAQIYGRFISNPYNANSFLSNNGVFVKECKIFSNQILDSPIHYTNPPINDMDILGSPPLNVSNINIINTNTCQLTYNPPNPLTLLNNHTFYIDLYESNANGDLVNYIGTFNANGAVNNSTSPLITAPNGINLNSINRFAYIVNSYATAQLSNPDHEDHSGSSFANYLGGDYITTCCPNLQASMTLGGQTYTYSPNTGNQTVDGCLGELLLTTSNCSAPTLSSYQWRVVVNNSTPIVFTNATQYYTIPANATSVTVYLENTPSSSCTFSWSVTFNNLGACTLPCEDCIGSFSPTPGKKYVVSAWVKDESTLAQRNTFDSYTHIAVAIDFELSVGSPPSTLYCYPTGQIIDDWQLIEKEFTVPADANKIKISLYNGNSQKDAFFDDVRIFPADGNMKSFVYDRDSKRLMAELDERNYATLYDYDEEGKLVRIKKETEKGVYTIKESRTGLMKKP